MSEDLVAFLRARLNEDAAVARAAGLPGQQTWEADLSGKDPIGLPSWPLVVRYVTNGRLSGVVAHLPVMAERSEDRMAHMARHDPARVLAEVDAKRRMIDQVAAVHASAVDMAHACCHEPGQILAGECREFAPGDLPLLRLLAVPYASHPGYLPEWAPDA